MSSRIGRSGTAQYVDELVPVRRRDRDPHLRVAPLGDEAQASGLVVGHHLGAVPVDDGGGLHAHALVLAHGGEVLLILRRRGGIPTPGQEIVHRRRTRHPPLLLRCAAWRRCRAATSDGDTRLHLAHAGGAVQVVRLPWGRPPFRLRRTAAGRPSPPCPCSAGTFSPGRHRPVRCNHCLWTYYRHLSVGEAPLHECPNHVVPLVGVPMQTRTRCARTMCRTCFTCMLVLLEVSFSSWVLRGRRAAALYSAHSSRAPRRACHCRRTT